VKQHFIMERNINAQKDCEKYDERLACYER